ncbi:hypothetical protein H4V99_000105 [Cryobacterium sp. CG_9.6]|nr:hypothetical protein [Cryobacterium sp. CG_9.6]
MAIVLVVSALEELDMKPTSSPQNPMPRDVREAAEYLHVNIHFVRRLVRDRKIPFVKLGHLMTQYT